MPGMVHNIRIVFGAQTQPSITIQQSDYNSRTIQAACFTSSGTPMDFSDTTVTVVYNAGADPTKEYPVTVEGNNLSFTMPGLAAQTAGSWSMQIFIYWAGSLLHSAEIPYTVLKTITPGTGGDDPVPALVLLIQQAQEAIAGANEAASTANQAAGSANSAANSANEKAGIAVSAANSANEAASNAATMASLAQTATANANSAANSASNAAESANQAAASANAAAASASQVADDVQQKADSGAFNGKNGLDAPQIDDTQITTTNPWSSMQIVKTLCPTFTVSGATVQCTPVANYPLDVQVEITPTQEGTGDPSPENVRPIVGWDAVNVTRCGKNLFDISTIITNSEIKNNGDSLTVNTSLVSVRCATSESLEDICHNIPANVLYNFNANTTSKLKQAYFNSGVLWKFATSQNLDDPTKKSPIYFYGNSINETSTISNIQLEIGSTATEYEPYRGETYTVQLGQTVYGGTLDVGTGTLTVMTAILVLDGVTNKVVDVEFSISNGYAYSIRVNDYPKMHNFVAACSHYKIVTIEEPISSRIPGTIMSTGIYGYGGIFIVTNISTADEMNSFLEQQNSNGTPVQIIRELGAPTTIQLTPQQITAISKTNTIYADSGSVTVSGYSDPISTIASLQSRVSALESAQTNM